MPKNLCSGDSGLLKENAGAHIYLTCAVFVVRNFLSAEQVNTMWVPNSPNTLENISGVKGAPARAGLAPGCSVPRAAMELTSIPMGWASYLGRESFERK